jgi:hypothetical protein
VSQNGKSDIVHGTSVPGQSRIASARVGSGDHFLTPVFTGDIRLLTKHLSNNEPTRCRTNDVA